MFRKISAFGFVVIKFECDIFSLPFNFISAHVKPSVSSTTQTTPSPPIATHHEVTRVNDPVDSSFCGDDQFQCSSLALLCVPLKSVCDGFGDCPEAEDEMNCNGK